VVEEAVIYVVMIAIGSPAVVAALVRGARFGGGTTLCLVWIALGALGLARLAHRRTRLPRAREVRRRAGRDSR
jgi:hypothetical protein